MYWGKFFLRNKLVRLFLGILFISVFTVTVAFGQETTGSIMGVITDPSGAVIPGVAVTAASGQRSYTETSGPNGVYTFLKLPADVYSITAVMKGFSTLKLDAVTVELGKIVQVNLAMKVGQTDVTVEVTSAEAPMLDVTTSKTSSNITMQEIQALPKTLNFSSVVVTAPGTRSETKAGGYQVDGASGSENTFVVDGLEVTRIQDGTLGTTKNIPFDFVQEVQVKSAGYEAEYGGALGGVVNVATRSGSNAFHGELRVDYQNDGLTTNTRPSRRFDRIAIAQTPRVYATEYYNNPTGNDKYWLINPTFNLGGPLLKDKIWFYTSYSPEFWNTTHRTFLMLPITSTNLAVKYTDSRDTTTKEKYDYFFGRLDFSPISKVQINASFVNSPYKQTGVLLGGYDTTSTTAFNNLIYSKQGGFTPSNQFTIAATYSATPSLVISGRVGRMYTNDKGGNYAVPTNTPLVVISNPCSGSFCPPGSTTTGNPTIQTNTQTLWNIFARTGVSFDATYNVRIGGQQHIFKGGYARYNLMNDVNSQRSGGQFNFYYGQSDPYFGTSGTYGYYTVTQYGTVGKASSANQGFYFQDTWQIHRNVTLNLGVRFENEYVPAYPFNPAYHPGIDPSALAEIQKYGAQPIKFGWGDKIAPRLGAAWNVFGNNKLKIWGSFSMFYDTMKYEMPRGSFGGDMYIVTNRALNDPNFNIYNLSNTPGQILSGPFDYRVPSLVTQGGIPPIDPNLKPIREREYTAGADFALSSDMVLSARFTRKQLDRTIEDVGLPFVQSGIVNEVFFISNPGFGNTVTKFKEFGLPATPKAVRNYTGLEIRLDKRFSKNWYANLSYIYSRLYGNYSGLASSDENGRVSPNVNRYFDLPEMVWEPNGQLSNGLLPTDRPNTFKAFGAYNFKWGILGNKMETMIGAFQVIYQGIPVTTIVPDLISGTTDGLYDGAWVYPNGRGDMGRTPVYTQTDALVTHTFSVGERAKVKFSFNVQNLFNQATVTNIAGTYVRGSTATIGNEMNRPAYRATYSAATYPLAVQAYLNSNMDWKTRIPASYLNPFYGKPDTFQGPRYVRFNIAFVF